MKIAIANRKGGVGKSTAAVHIGSGFALAAKSVLLIDCDSQSQCAMMLGVRPDRGLADLLRGEAFEECVTEARENLHLLAGGLALSSVSREISLRTMGVEFALSEALAPVEQGYDYVILDGAPGFSTLSVNMLVYADYVICPVLLEAAAIDGLINFDRELAPITKRTGTELRYVLPRYDGRVKQSSEYLEILRDQYDGRVLDPIPYDVRISEAAGHGKTIWEYAPGRPSALAFEDVVRTIYGA